MIVLSYSKSDKVDFSWEVYMEFFLFFSNVHLYAKELLIFLVNEADKNKQILYDFSVKYIHF